MLCICDMYDETFSFLDILNRLVALRQIERYSVSRKPSCCNKTSRSIRSSIFTSMISIRSEPGSPRLSASTSIIIANHFLHPISTVLPEEVFSVLVHMAPCFGRFCGAKQPRCVASSQYSFLFNPMLFLIMMLYPFILYS